MKTFLSTLATMLIGIMLGLLIAGLLFLTTRTPSGQPVTLLPSPTPKPIQVYVTGAVKHPGVFLLPRDSRARDAILAAGGFMEEGVDVNQINLAEVMTDGKHLEVPGTSPFATPQLTIGGSGLLVTPTPPNGQAVNINTATKEQLEALPGIGETTAQAIIDYREENGPFSTVEDLLKIPGIGPSTLEQLEGLITTGS